MTLAEILHRVCMAYDVTKAEFMSRGHHRRLTQARAAFCYWSRIKTGKSFTVIARHIGRDHTTVVHHYHTYPVKAARYRDQNVVPCMLAVNA